jgi:tetratricopeptide (TPR) repeat protein
MSTSTEHMRGGSKPAPAGILNSKTLAEENLKGFRLRNL